MTLMGLAAPYIVEPALKKISPTPKKRHPSTLNLRSSLAKGGVPAWQVHFLQLLKQVPTGTAVKCKNPKEIVRLESTKPSRKSSTTSCDTQVTDTEDDTHPLPGKESKELKEKSDFESAKERMKHRRLLESRIKSLRLEIGDLSIAENLEKLCNHYFKLDKTSIKQDSEFNRKLSLLFSKSEEEEKRKSVNHSTHKKHSVSFSPDIEVLEERKLSFTSSSSSENILTFDDIFHGYLSKKETEKLLLNEGDFLIRNVLHEKEFILSFRFNGTIHNFRIFKDLEFGDLYYLEDRRNCYGSLEEMVNEGLQTLFLDLKAGSYIDVLTEVASIKKHDSMISWLSPGGSSSRKSSGGSSPNIFIGGRTSRRPSENPIILEEASGSLDPESCKEEEENELEKHFFIPGTINLDKKTPCDLEDCLLRKKVKQGNNNDVPSGKNTIVCRDCGLVIHEKCTTHLENSTFLKCFTELYKIPEIFGADLTTLVKATRNEEGKVGRKPPFVITKCVEELQVRIGGLGSEGIYRVSGSQEDVMKIQNVLEKDRENSDLSPFEDLNSICGVLKLYLRLLPEPLITFDVFTKFHEDFNNNVPLSCEGAKKNLMELPPAHKITLKYILQHLCAISLQRESNKMSAYNLSSVLAPSIIVPEEMSLMTLKIATDVVDLLIRNMKHFNFFD